MTTTDTTRPLRRVRIFVRGCFWTGISVSLTANVLHADNNLISQAIAAWAPLALLLTVELLSRVPMSRRSTRSWLRILFTGVVAAIAAWVSYWHMVGVAFDYGETGYTPYLLPLSVDGLVVIASISLVEIHDRLRTPIFDTPPAITTTTTMPAPTNPVPVPAPSAPGLIPAATLTQLAANRPTRARHNGAPVTAAVQDTLL